MTGVEDIAGKLIDIVANRLKTGLTRTSSLVEEQARFVARQTVLLAKLRLGSLKDDDEAFQKAVDALADEVKNFNLLLVNLALIDAQHAYDDAMDVVWTGLDKLVTPLGLNGILRPPMP